MTYSTNFGNPAIEATNWESLQFIFEQLPDNTGQFISPRDVRDAIFTTWEQGVFKVLESGSEKYIGTDNGGTISNFRYKMFLGKKELQSGNTILDSTLLNSDTDIFIYNNKSDSNLSSQDTKMSFLAGDDFTSFPYAPYIQATKITGTSSNRIDLNITNPSVNGIIEINSDIIELGNNGWVIDDTSGTLYPQNNAQNIGLTGSGNRIGTIYMNSTVDYLNDLNFISGSSSITFDTDGMITTDSLYIQEDLKFRISATPGYFLSTDSIGNATWGPGKIDTVGVTQGYMNIANGLNDINWVLPYGDATGITAGYILQSVGNTASFGARPEWRGFDNLITGATAGYVLGSDGSNTTWVSNVTGAGGSNLNVQFNNGGFLDGDSDFVWDDSNKRLGIGTSSPTRPLSILGGSQFDDIYLSNRIYSNDSSAYIDLNSDVINFGSTASIFGGGSTTLQIISGDLYFESPNSIKFLAENQGFEVVTDDADIRHISNNQFYVESQGGDINGIYLYSESSVIIEATDVSGGGAGYGDISLRTDGGLMIINSNGNIGINESNPSEILHLNLTEESRNTIQIESQVTSTQSMSINLLSNSNGASADRKHFSLSVDNNSGSNIFSINSLFDNLTPNKKIIQILNDGYLNTSVGIDGIEFSKHFYVNGNVRFDGQLETRYNVRRLVTCRNDADTGTWSTDGGVYDEHLIFYTSTSLVSCLPGSSYQIYDEYRIMDSQNLQGNRLYFQNKTTTDRDIVMDSGSNIIVSHNSTTPISSLTLNQGEGTILIYDGGRWFETRTFAV